MPRLNKHREFFRFPKKDERRPRGEYIVQSDGTINYSVIIAKNFFLTIVFTHRSLFLHFHDVIANIFP